MKLIVFFYNGEGEITSTREFAGEDTIQMVESAIDEESLNEEIVSFDTLLTNDEED